MLNSILYKDLKIKGNIFSAPLAGYSNYPTRMIYQKYGADLTFTEMVSVYGIVYQDNKTLDLMYTTEQETSKAVQIFGDDKILIKEAIDYIDENTPYNIVNLNAGCPMKKIIKAHKGGALIRDVDKLKGILEYLASRIKIPFTLKIRSGWDSSNINYQYIGKMAQENNCKLIILHPRTVKQVFTGRADWSRIYDLKEKLYIPVIGNGDIYTPEQAHYCLKEHSLDGIMIARGSFGHPWIFNQIKSYCKVHKYDDPNLKQRLNIMLEHLQGMIDHFGEDKGVKIFRCQIMHYLKGFKNSAKIRQKLHICNDLVSIKEVLQPLFNN